MPKYFKTRNEMLYAEAVATFYLLDALLQGNLVLYASNKMIKIHRNAQNRCCRRFKKL